MRIVCWALAALLLSSSGLRAEDQAAPTATQSAPQLPDWAPGPFREATAQPPPGRVASSAVGVALTLPESWRGDDVTWRELNGEEAKAINPLAQAALVVEFKGKRGAVQPLLTVFRVPLKPWRDAAREEAAGPGRITLISSEIGYAVIRSPEPAVPGRFSDLHDDLEDAIGTLGLYDAYRENRHLIPKIQSDFIGTMGDGSPVKLHLGPNGVMTLTWGTKAEVVEGLWFQRDAQVVGHLRTQKVQKGAARHISPEMLFHYDGRNLIVITWDQEVLGVAGIRLEPAP